MLDSNEAKRAQDQDQQKFSVRDFPAHEKDNALTAHFNELLALMSTEVMGSLLTTQQKNTIKALEDAFDGGARVTKQSRKELYEWVLRIDHRQKLEEIAFYKKNAKL